MQSDEQWLNGLNSAVTEEYRRLFGRNRYEGWAGALGQVRDILDDGRITVEPDLVVYSAYVQVCDQRDAWERKYNTSREALSIVALAAGIGWILAATVALMK